MRLVIDTNIVFSALLNKHSSIGDIILNSQNTFIFYGCESLKEEIKEHQHKIINLSQYNFKDYEEVETLVFERIEFLSESSIPYEYWKKAAELLRDIDMDDIAFVAMSIYFDIRIWTGDKQLINGLMNKGFQNLITTQELLRIRETS